MGANIMTTSKTVNRISAVKNRVIVSDMHFGEQKTAGGLILTDDNGTNRGIYPRWARVYAKGPENHEDYGVGDWVLVEHGRWTRGVDIQDTTGEKNIRMVEAESILGWSHEKPSDAQFSK